MSAADPGLRHLGIVGFGEVGRIFAAGLRARLDSVTVWDQKLDDPACAGDMRVAAQAAGVQACNSMAQACAGRDLVISAVTASSTLEVARSAAACLGAGALFLDLNSASPGTKQEAARCLEAVGVRYVEAGVMTSVPPHGIRVPMLLGGPHAGPLSARLAQWGMDARAVSTELGVASAIKMSRSVMIKGLEALVIESYATARAYGVEAHMLATLAETFPGIDWSRQGAYFFSRVVQHGERRAQEMREAARTVREAGFQPLMTAAIAERQQWVADRARSGLFAGVGRDARWEDWADRLLAARSGPDAASG